MLWMTRPARRTVREGTHIYGSYGRAHRLCPENRTVEHAGVSVTQPQASGRWLCRSVRRPGSLFHGGGAHPRRPVRHRVGPSERGPSGQTGPAKQVRHSAQIPVEPLVTVTVASHAQPAGGSEAVLINGTAASPTSSTGQPSDVSVFKYPAHGMGMRVGARTSRPARLRRSRHRTVRAATNSDECCDGVRAHEAACGLHNRRQEDPLSTTSPATCTLRMAWLRPEGCTPSCRDRATRPRAARVRDRYRPHSHRWWAPGGANLSGTPYRLD